MTRYRRLASHASLASPALHPGVARRRSAEEDAVMRYPGNSDTQPARTDPTEKLSGSFARLKAATGFARPRPAAPTESPPVAPAPEPPVVEAPVVEAAAASEPPEAPKAGPGPSVFSTNAQVKGTFTAPGDLHIHGAIDGNVRAGS